jgi:hypothetical protein
MSRTLATLTTRSLKILHMDDWTPHVRGCPNAYRDHVSVAEFKALVTRHSGIKWLSQSADEDPEFYSHYSSHEGEKFIIKHTARNGGASLSCDYVLVKEDGTWVVDKLTIH